MARGSQAWFNGKIVPVENAKVSLFTHGLHYGTGAFEGIRAYRQKRGGGAVFRLREHMQRFEETWKIMGFQLPFGVDELVQACTATCKANGFEECYLRPISFIADGPLGVYPGENPPIDVAIVVWEWGNYLGDKGKTEGAKLKISSYLRPHVNSVMTKGKISGQYVTGVVAKKEAISHGYDEALMLDPEGYLTEGTGENLFIVKDGKIKTTPPTSILNGITRQSVIQYLTDQGHSVTEARFTRDELICADEVFLTGTAAEITPVSEIDRRKIGRGAHTGRPGPFSTKLQSEYAALVRGEYPKYATWLTPISGA